MTQKNIQTIAENRFSMVIHKRRKRTKIERFKYIMSSIMSDFKTAFGLGLHTFILLLSIFAAFIIVAAGANAARAASIKDISLIRGDVITVGDVFGENANRADYVLGPAPLPGKDMVLNSRTLMRIARAMDINWRPSSIEDSVTLRRLAVLIDSDQIENAIAQELRNEGVYGDFRVSFYDEAPQIILPEGASRDLVLRNLNFNAAEKRFSVTVETQDRSKTVHGEIRHQVNVPVLRSTMQYGDIISRSDLDWIMINENRIQHNFVLNDDDLIGMTPRRVGYSGKPIQKTELVAPQIIDRGERVTLIVKNGSMILTAQGKAMQSGAKGDIVRAVNINSSRNVQGVVTGTNEITIAGDRSNAVIASQF